MTKERKQEIINTYKREEKDTGSPEVQIALLTERINELSTCKRQPFKTWSIKNGRKKKKLIKLPSKKRCTKIQRHRRKIRIKKIIIKKSLCFILAWAFNKVKKQKEKIKSEH